MRKYELLLNPVGGGALGGGLGCQEDKRAGLLQLFLAQCRLALLCRHENVLRGFKTSPQPSPNLGEGVRSLEKERVINYSCVSTVNSLPSCPLALRKCLAFTLAELLITLGIIGIVAALTIPNLVSGYKKHVVETQLKKAYSILNQVVQHSQVDNGPAINWDWENTHDIEKTNAFFDKYFAPYLNITDKKSGYGANRYFDVYVNNSQFTSWYYNNAENMDWRLLSDGSALIFKPATFAGVLSGSFSVVLPSSTKKKHLIMGRDVFTFAINYTSNKSAVTVFPQSWRNWNCDFVKENYSDFIERCNGKDEDGNSPANSCSILLYCNGWKVPDDYPIKF